MQAHRKDDGRHHRKQGHKHPAERSVHRQRDARGEVTRSLRRVHSGGLAKGSAQEKNRYCKTEERGHDHETPAHEETNKVLARFLLRHRYKVAQLCALSEGTVDLGRHLSAR